MAGLPDFSLVCNSAKRATPEKKLPGDYYVAYKKLYDMCTPTTISEKNAVKQQRPSQKVSKKIRCNHLKLTKEFCFRKNLPNENTLMVIRVWRRSYKTYF